MIKIINENVIQFIILNNNIQMINQPRLNFFIVLPISSSEKDKLGPRNYPFSFFILSLDSFV
jgi:hypothetical protein